MEMFICASKQLVNEKLLFFTRVRQTSASLEQFKLSNTIIHLVATTAAGYGNFGGCWLL